MQELLNKHMIGTFAIEDCGAYCRALHHRVHWYAPARQEDRSSAQHPPVPVDCVFALFLASILSLTLTPIGSANSVTNPELYYPRFYVAGAGSRRGI